MIKIMSKKTKKRNSQNLKQIINKNTKMKFNKIIKKKLFLNMIVKEMSMIKNSLNLRQAKVGLAKFINAMIFKTRKGMHVKNSKKKKIIKKKKQIGKESDKFWGNSYITK